MVTVGIFLSLLFPALDFFREVSIWDFLTGTRWAPTFADADFGVLPLDHRHAVDHADRAADRRARSGSARPSTSSEYAHERIRKVLKPVLEVLAGIPSVVYGYFALYFVAPELLRRAASASSVGTFSVLAAGLVLGIMIIPTVASLSEDAMSAVPQALRQGSYALGANKMRTTLRVVFPAAISGITAVDRARRSPARSARR